jgi:hypothetical protein
MFKCVYVFLDPLYKHTQCSLQCSFTCYWSNHDSVQDFVQIERHVSATLGHHQVYVVYDDLRKLLYYTTVVQRPQGLYV